MVGWVGRWEVTSLHCWGMFWFFSLLLVFNFWSVWLRVPPKSWVTDNLLCPSSRVSSWSEQSWRMEWACLWANNHWRWVLRCTVCRSVSSGHPFLFFFWTWVVVGGPCCKACEICVPQTGTEPVSLAVKTQNPNPWTAREFPPLSILSGFRDSQWVCRLKGSLEIITQLKLQFIPDWLSLLLGRRPPPSEAACSLLDPRDWWTVLPSRELRSPHTHPPPACLFSPLRLPEEVSVLPRPPSKGRAQMPFTRRLSFPGCTPPVPSHITGRVWKPHHCPQQDSLRVPHEL